MKWLALATTMPAEFPWTSMVYAFAEDIVLLQYFNQIRQQSSNLDHDFRRKTWSRSATTHLHETRGPESGAHEAGNAGDAASLQSRYHRQVPQSSATISLVAL